MAGARRRLRRLVRAALAVLVLAGAGAGAEPLALPEPGSLRFAQFNVALSRQGAGVLLRDLARRDPQVLAVAEIVLRVRPDVLLLNELDHDPEGRALDAFAGLLAEGVAGLDGLAYRHRYLAPVNTGVPSGHDLDGDGRQAGADDAFGWGRFPGQYGMALMSRLPVDAAAARTFRTFRWADLPTADRPATPDGPHHADAVWQALRLSSKSHWDVPIVLPEGGRLHVLALHPTPPVFDGPEDFNGRRNADELRLLLGLIDGADWLVDDAGGGGGLPADARFVVMGDLNADPHRGDARRAPPPARRPTRSPPTSAPIPARGGSGWTMCCPPPGSR